MSDAERRKTVAERAAREGAEVAVEGFRAGLEVETKEGKTDYVTQADRDAQQQVVDAIRASFPEDPIVGEEEGTLGTVPEEGPAWIVDPIDGTNNYVREVPVWCTSVAAVVDGDPVAAANVLPALGDVYVAGPEEVTRNGDPISVSARTDPQSFTVVPTFWWDYDSRDEYARAATAVVERFGDMRRWGCAQATLGMIADGGIEGAFTNLRANPWDTVAGVHMVRVAGGTVTDLEGDPWRHDSEGLVASNGECHDEVLAAAQETEG
ncbi:inositol monophosphatase [Halobacteriales archaeon QS_1_68_20]|nr:MAG: inositol monophosphatase [Halobacteriales archaeon QS_1_68_20]